MPFIAGAQTKTDAEHVMARLQKFYNAGQYDSVYTLFSDSDRKMLTKERNSESMKWFADTAGKMLSFQYLGVDNDDPDHVTVFMTKWSKNDDKTSSFSLDRENKFLDFRLWTSSPGIDKLLKKNK